MITHLTASQHLSTLRFKLKDPTRDDQPKLIVDTYKHIRDIVLQESESNINAVSALQSRKTKSGLIVNIPDQTIYKLQNILS
jgi:hypothetical protein